MAVGKPSASIAPRHRARGHGNSVVHGSMIFKMSTRRNGGRRADISFRPVKEASTMF